MARYEIPLNGAGPYYLVLYTSQSGRTVSATTYWRRDSYGYGSYSGGASWSIVIAGVVFSGVVNFDAPGGGAIGETYIAGASQYVYSGSVVPIYGGFDTGVSPGSGGINATEVIGTAPPAPSMLSVGGATATSLVARFQSNGDGGSPITSWALQYAINPTFVGAVTIGSSGTSTVTGLIPGSTYYFRARGQNAFGVSAWSAVMSGTTLPLTAPGITVTPSLSGTSARVTLAPPNVTGSVSRYRVERRLFGTTAATGYNTTSTTLNVDGLTPGAIYEWRAYAVVNTKNSPWTAWKPVLQPQPNTVPGDYFDGSTPARTDLTFAWTGTVNNSTSEARGVGVDGWEANARNSGATVRLQRSAGGRSGESLARMLVISDEVGFGAELGTSAAVSKTAPIASGGQYFGSIYVRPSRSQRLAARIYWTTSSGGSISSDEGEAQVVTDLTGWTRLVVSGQAPSNATRAYVRVADVAGTGRSPWLGGEWLDADDAMISIGLYPWFSGDTPDSAEFSYDWLGAANASTSVRLNNVVDPIDLLLDPDCPPIPAAPRPPSIDSTCIEEVGTWRRYWAIIPESEVYDWLDVVPTLTLSTGFAPTRQARIRFYPNPDQLDPGDAGGLPWESEQTVSFIPPNTEFVLDGVSQRAWASVNGSDEISADHLLYGTNNGPATWPTLSCGSSYLISFDVPLDAPDGNVEVGVGLTTRMM